MTLREMETKAREYRGLIRMQEELEAEIEALKDALKAAMGDKEKVIAGEYKITWQTVNSARVDTTALKAALPDVAARFTKTTTSRRFQVA